jgi:hypothetical protein
MDYKLARKLRDAGFPQKAPGYFDVPSLGEAPPVKFPTLSELIEACGDGFFSLSKHANIWQTNWRDGMAGDTPVLLPRKP